MENFDLTALDRFGAKKIHDYVAVIGKVTRTMNLRIVVKNDASCKWEYNALFECGVDILPLANGGNIIITTLGFYAFSFVEFVENFLTYQRQKIKEQASTLRYFGKTTTVFGIGFIFEDDTEALSTWDEDEDGNVIDNVVDPQFVEDDKLSEGLQCYDTCDEFYKVLKTH